jgi:hypothetical protein
MFPEFPACASVVSRCFPESFPWGVLGTACLQPATAMMSTTKSLTALLRGKDSIRPAAFARMPTELLEQLGLSDMSGFEQIYD